jgi:hypothetical protein
MSENCLDPRCQHPRGWHRFGTGACLECGCTEFKEAENSWSRGERVFVEHVERAGELAGRTGLLIDRRPDGRMFIRYPFGTYVIPEEHVRKERRGLGEDQARGRYARMREGLTAILATDSLDEAKRVAQEALVERRKNVWYGW